MNRVMGRTTFAVAVLGGALWLGGCGGGDKGAETGQTPGGGDKMAATPAGDKMAPAGGEKPAGGAALKVTVIPKGLTHSFWQSIKRGAEKAGGEMNVTVDWQGPASESDGVKEQQQIVEDAITKKVDGIVIAPINRVALVPAIEKAAAANIPVVIADSDANTKKRISFVATDNYKGGAMAAERVFTLIKGKGTVGMVPCQANSQSTEDREKGFEETLKKLGKGSVKVVRSQYGESDRAKSLNVCTDMLTGNQDIVAIFGSNESSAVGALNAVKNQNKLGKIKIVGFDTPEILVAAVRKGDVDSIVVQNPFKMGYEGVKAIVDSKAGKTVAPSIDTGVKILTTADIDKPENKEFLQ